MKRIAREPTPEMIEAAAAVWRRNKGAGFGKAISADMLRGAWDAAPDGAAEVADDHPVPENERGPSWFGNEGRDCCTSAAPDADAGQVQITIGLPTIHALVRGEAVELERATLYGASDLQTWGQWTENDGRHDPERVAELQRRIERALQVLAHTPHEWDIIANILRGESS